MSADVPSSTSRKRKRKVSWKLRCLLLFLGLAVGFVVAEVVLVLAGPCWSVVPDSVSCRSILRNGSGVEFLRLVVEGRCG